MPLKIQCPECRGQFRVDGEESRSRFDCPFCAAPFRFQDKHTVVLSTSPLTPIATEPLPAEATAIPEATDPAETPSSDAPRELTDEAARRADEARHREAVTRPATPVPPQRSRFVAPEPPSPEELTPLRPGDVLNGMRLEEVIGWGGMSVVFRAQQLSLGRNVACKVMRRELGEDPEFSRRFLNEARALAELSHPNIVQVIDQGIHEGNHYLIMEYIDGVSLREVLAERRLTPAEALRLVPDLCSALEYAHGRGIIHRDIKPENILVTKAGIPKVADFGLVRMIGEEAEEYSRITQTRTVLGTVDYMAPEQREGQHDVDHRADIYSLGVVLYEMLTGELPIARFPLPSERASVDARLDDVVLKVLQKDRDRRYQRASLIATDLEGLDRAPARGRCGWKGWRGPWGPPRNGPGRRRHGEIEGGRTASEARALAGGPSRPARGTHLIGQIASLFWFPLVVIFFGLSADDEVAAFAGGASLPWFLMQCRSYGWLPSIHERVLAKRWLGWIALPVLVVLVQERQLAEDPGLLAIGFILSSIFALRPQPWSRDAHIETGPFATVPRGVSENLEDARPLAGISRESQVSARPAPPTLPARPAPGEVPSPPPVAVGGDGPLAAAAVTAHRSEPDPTRETDITEPAREPRKRTSIAASLAFAGAIIGVLYASAIAVPLFIAGDGWHEALLDLPIPYRDIEEGMHEVATYSPEPLRSAVGLRGLLLVPLAIPLLFALIALPGVVDGRRRGGSLTVLAFGFLIAGLVLILVSTGFISDTVDRYCHEYDDAPRDSLELVRTARDGEESLGRVAALHRFAGRELSPQEERAAAGVLVEIALDPDRSVQERKVALVLLDWAFEQSIHDPREVTAVPDWPERFARLARPESRIPDELRRGFRTLLGHLDRS